MMTMRKYFIIILISVLFSCDGIEKEKINEVYYLTNLDYTHLTWDISYRLSQSGYIGVVGPRVAAYGYDDEFIIAKQNPLIEYRYLDTSVVNYYIIPLKFSVHESPDENYLGPFTYKEFLQKREEIGVSEKLKFSHKTPY